LIRKTSTKVVQGKVQPKNRIAPTWNNGSQEQGKTVVIERERPGQGFRHVLRKQDIVKFIGLLPDWEQLSKGLHTIVLARGEADCDGWHIPGAVGVCAWERQMWRKSTHYDCERDLDILQRLDVPVVKQDRRLLVCQFSEASIRGFQLLRVLLHELGHHHDQMTTRSKNEPSRGETYAEAYAKHYEKVIWDRFLDRFGLY